jgi:hypothetical protein
MEEIVSKWRYNVLHGLFVSVALKRYNVAQSLYFELMSQDTEDANDETYCLLRQLQESCIESIIFSVMALESYINTFSSVYISQNFADENDRLDIPSKWINTMRRLTGIELNRGATPIQRIAKSVRSRNSLVHSKSKAVTASEEGTQIPQLKIREKLLLPAYESLLTLVECATWVEINCGKEFVTICESDFSEKFNDDFKKINETWRFQEPSILF